jgi:hypothetical protein
MKNFKKRRPKNEFCQPIEGKLLIIGSFGCGDQSNVDWVLAKNKS